MAKKYQRVTWQNDQVTALNEVNLNKMDNGIDTLDTALDQAETNIANLSTNKQDKLTAGTNITITNNVISATGGGGGTSNYTDLTNKPKINGVELSGNKTSADLNISANVKYGTTSQFNTYKQDTSVPVGTEYIVTDDFENDNVNKYSTEETIVGSFLGKTLYRKVFETTQATTTSQTDFSSVVIQNANLVSLNFVCNTSYGQWCIAGQGYLKSNGTLNARTLTGSGTVTKTYVICEYIKE